MPSIDDLLRDHAHAWRTYIDAQAPVPPRPVGTADRPLRWRRMLVAVAASCLALAGVAVLVTRSGDAGHHAMTAQSNVHPSPTTATPAQRHPSRQVTPTPVPSPISQAWGACGNIRGDADAKSLVTSGDANSLIEADAHGATISSYRVLAGHVVDLHTLEAHDDLPAGRYLILLGGRPGSYYAAFGFYGVYRIDGKHAYQLCAYGAPERPRGGVTTTIGLIELLRNALRK